LNRDTVTIISPFIGVAEITLKIVACASSGKQAYVNGSQLSYWPRLCAKQQQRDDALNEIRVAYFLDSVGYSVIDWEPVDAGERKLEYAVAIPDQRMLVEVKSPGWEAEVSVDQRAAGRTKESKYRENIPEGGAAGPVQVIRRAVEKALPKFTGNSASLVVIADDSL
jgi:hypothetical protein